MAALNFIDYMLIVVVLLSAVISLFRGFFKEALSLASWVLAIWVAWQFGPTLAGGIAGWVEEPLLQLWVSRALLFVGVLILGGLIGKLMDILMTTTGLTGTDRAIGVVFGLGRGVILVGVLLVVLKLMGFGETSWWQESKLIPYAEPVEEIIRHAAEDGLEYIALESRAMPVSGSDLNVWQEV